MFAILKSLKLTCSPKKTKMGALKKGFHFLGITFEMTQTSQREIHVELELYKRTIERGRSKAICRSYAVNPDTTRKYLCSWSTGSIAAVVKSLKPEPLVGVLRASW